MFSPLEVHPRGFFITFVARQDTTKCNLLSFIIREGTFFWWYFENMGGAPAVFSILITLLIPIFRRFLHAQGARLSQNRAACAAERGSAQFRFDFAYFDTLFFFLNACKKEEVQIVLATLL